MSTLTDNRSNFLYYSLESFLASRPTNELIEKDLADEIQKIIKNLNQRQILVIAHIWESIDPARWKIYLEKIISCIKEKIPNLKVIQIANSWYKAHNAKLINSDSIYYVDFFLLRVFYHTLIEKLSTPSPKWDNNASHFLFLTGKPAKFNRTRLFYKLIEKGLDAQMVWSFNCQSQEEIQASSKYVSELSIEEFTKFVKTYQNFPDNNYKPEIPWTKPWAQFEEHLYKNKLFNVVSETNFDRLWMTPWITEKTWLPIVNRLPFIVAGEFKTVERLNEMGFDTFTDTMLIPNFDNPELSNYLHYQTDYSINGFIQTDKSESEWADFYHSFKGVDWPDVVSMNDIKNLSLEQQKEIANSFRIGIQSWSELRIDAIIQNTVFWLNNINYYQDRICAGINNNYNRFIELGEKNLKLVDDLKDENCLTGNLLQKMLKEVRKLI